jgi:hypothetical protein
MDDTYFLRCTFIKCKLIYLGGDYGWDACKFAEDCELSLGGPALRVHKFMKHVRMVKEPTPETSAPIPGTSGLIH